MEGVWGNQRVHERLYFQVESEGSSDDVIVEEEEEEEEEEATMEPHTQSEYDLCNLVMSRAALLWAGPVCPTLDPDMDGQLHSNVSFCDTHPLFKSILGPCIQY